MRNQLFIIAMRELGAVANEFREPVRPGRNRNIETCKSLLAERAKRIVRTADAPFGGAMNGILGFRLTGVKRLNGVGIIMAQDTSRVDRVRPIACSQLVDGLLIPGFGFFRRAAPVSLRHMQDVVLEILEADVRRLRTFEVTLDMLQENPDPGILIAVLHFIECVERQLVMRAVGVRGIDNSKKRGHHGLGLTADRPCLA